jgi:two-component system, chemotaxis family, sensor histidine kinase and response regulator PixL
MALNSDIRDQAYQFFVEEAPELLQVIEGGLLALHQERSIGTVHNLMRAAHSIKGGASSIGLEAIATIAHRLEHIFKALYSDSLDITTDLEDQLLQAFDCLRNPLAEQITTGTFDTREALAIADAVFSKLEDQYQDALTQTENFVPTSSDLGVDMVASILEIDVAQGLERLADLVVSPQDYEVAGELRAQVEVFLGFSELLNLPEFGAIATAAQQALEAHPESAVEIAELALMDFERCRQAMLEGDRSRISGPSEILLAIATHSAPSLAVEVLPEDTGHSDPTEPLGVIEAPAPIQGHDSSDAHAYNDAIAPIPDLEDAGLTDALYYADVIDIDEALDEALDEAIDDLSTSLDAEEFDLDAASLQDLDQPGRLVPWRQSDDSPVAAPAELYTTTPKSEPYTTPKETPIAPPPLTVRVDADRLERMNNVVGELSINRDGLSLQNQQLQGTLKELINRFSRFQDLVSKLQNLSDKMLISPERQNSPLQSARSRALEPSNGVSNGYSNGFSDPTSAPFPTAAADFDPLEMDRYGSLNAQLQEIFEDTVQLEETVDDIVLFARQSNQILDQQRQMLNSLREELLWARMLPLGEVLNRFPRALHKLASTYGKPAKLTLTGTHVLVDKAILEKLYDPLLHLLRNAFDHGIESPEIRRQEGKPEQGEIEIRAYHRGNQTVIEVRDDGQGLNLDRIRMRALELGWLMPEQIMSTPASELFKLIFEPGFSTAQQVNELSGRGVGLDVVRSQLRAIKGTVAITSSPGQGTTFSLNLPLTLTMAKLVVCIVGTTALAMPTDDVEEIVTPGAGQSKQSGTQRFLYWREQIIPIYPLSGLVDYFCPLPDVLQTKALEGLISPEGTELPVLIMQRNGEPFALEVDRLVTEQELVIKPFGAAIASPDYIYGCTILGDGSLVPVVDGKALLELKLTPQTSTITVKDDADPIPPSNRAWAGPKALPPVKSTNKAPTILVVDDAVTLRRTLALSLERAGFRVMQAKDGWEAVNQLRQSTSVQLVVCDIEMPNMNGFEFLSYRRQDSKLAEIPIVMLTSRSNEKHRWLAMQLGATAYFTKPYLEQEFLSTLRNLIREHSTATV